MTISELAKKVTESIEKFKGSYAKQVQQSQAQEPKIYVVGTNEIVTPEQAFRLRLKNMIYQDNDELRHEEEELRKLREKLVNIGDNDLLKAWEREKREHDKRVEAEIDSEIERKRRNFENTKKEALALYNELYPKVQELKQRLTDDNNSNTAASLQEIQDLAYKLATSGMLPLPFLLYDPMLDMYKGLLYSVDRLEKHLLAHRDSLFSTQFDPQSARWW